MTKITSRYEELVSEAEAAVRAYTSEEAVELIGEDGVFFVDVRDALELGEGMINGAIHASRGRLEAHLDPNSTHYREEFDAATELVFYCATGKRSALAARRAQQLGFERSAHLEGGFAAWMDAGGPIQLL